MEEQAVSVTLNQITLEVKFYLNQTAQNIIEVGKRLNQAKAMLPHGEFKNWLEENFKLSQRTANNFMAVAERFGNSPTSANLNQSQMVEMLALPEGEEEKFISEKADEGTPVEDMTVKTLREEVAKYKADYESEKAKVENLFADLEKAKTQKEWNERTFKQQAAELKELQKDNGRLKAKFDTADKLANQYHVERDQLKRQLENQKPIVVEPEDYQQLKNAREQLQAKIEYLEKELTNKTVEVVAPADYDATKKELVKLKADQSEITQRMDVFQKLDAVARNIRDVLNSQSKTGIEDYARDYNDRFGGMCADFQDFLNSFQSLYKREQIK